MGNQFDLPSWSGELPGFTVTPVGSAFHSIRTVFKVVCNTCRDIVHPATTSPPAMARTHSHGVDGALFGKEPTQ